ncbi:MAG: universal stress protein [Acidobacteriaceae bacterium]|nr:universal stress protein [Acidobacteriaceae bacterium]
MNTRNRLQFNTIVVATDFTDNASSALRYAKAVALRHKSVLVVVHVIDPVSYAFPEGIPEYAAADQAAREELLKIEEETRQHGIPIHSVVETGIVFERILQAVEDHDADLLVLGTRAKTGIGRAALGAVARRLLAKADCPVLTVPPDSEAHLPWAGHWSRVLVATDFSAASLSALGHAQRIAYEQLMVVHAADETSGNDCKRYIEQLRFLAPLNESHTLPVEHIVSAGEAGRVIVEHAKRFHADIVVLGSPGIELAEEDFHTSTVLQVVSQVDCPVLCVPCVPYPLTQEVVEEVALSC